MQKMQLIVNFTFENTFIHKINMMGRKENPTLQTEAFIEAIYEQIKANDAAKGKKKGKEINKGDIKKMLEALPKVVASGLEEGKKVRLWGLGTWRSQYTPARKGRDPRTGEVINISGRENIRFKASDSLTKAVNKQEE